MDIKDERSVREEVARIVESGFRRVTASSPPLSTPSEVTDMIMSVINDVAAETAEREYARGLSDGQFNDGRQP